MDKAKRDLLIAVVLVAVFAFFLVRNATSRRRPAGAAQTAAAERGLSADEVAAAASSLARIRQNENGVAAQEAFWEKEWGRDPFAPPSAGESGTTATLALTGIVWDARMPIAMINGSVLKAGDSIEGYKIAEIRQSSVVVEAPSGKRSEVKLFQQFSDR